MFSGGTYDEVGRWVRNFLGSHAKRENARAEVEVEERDETSYSARARLGGRMGAPIELAYADVAANRGSLEWCAGLAARVRGVVKDLGAAAA